MRDILIHLGRPTTFSNPGVRSIDDNRLVGPSEVSCARINVHDE
jgi:hypothetical protein